MSPDERALYDDVTDYLLSPTLHAFRGNARQLLLLGFHRRMASSIPALAESLDRVASRLRGMLGEGDAGATAAAEFACDLEEQDDAGACATAATVRAKSRRQSGSTPPIWTNSSLMVLRSSRTWPRGLDSWASSVSLFEAMLDLDLESLSLQDRRQWRRRLEEAYKDENMELLQASREFVQEHILELSESVVQLWEFLEELNVDAMDVDPVLVTLRKF